MIWLLANWRAVAISILIAIPAGYAAVTKIRLEHVKAQYAQYRAEVAATAAEAEVRTAQVVAEHAHNAQEVLDDLQTRNTALAARYQRLRDAGTGGRIVPAVSVAAAIVAAEPAGQPDAAARCVAETLAVLELGDRELAKYRELWELGQRNTEK